MGREERNTESENPAISRLIERTTNSTAPEVDPRLLKAIKSTVRSSSDDLRLAVHSLMIQMKKPHSQVRYLAVLVIDELFMRSKLFRSLFVCDLDQFLSLSVGFRRNMPLPPPSSIASNLRKMTIELLEKWNGSFGIHYRQLRLGFDYLKNTLRFQFPNRMENAARLQQERREREMRTQEILLSKYENLKENYSSIKAEIQSTIEEIAECMEIINVEQEEFTPNYEAEEFKSFTLQQLRLDSLKEGKKVVETSDNKAVLDTLRELHKLLVSKHLLSVQDWISLLIRVDLTDNKFRDKALKEFIDVRNKIQSLRNRCGQLGFVLDDVRKKMEEEEEDLWEEGKVEVYTAGTSDANISIVENDINISSTSKGKDVVPSDGEKALDSNGSGSNSERSKLLSEAPVMTWGPFLDNWGANRDVLANQRGLELEGHWGRVDYDAVIPAEKIAELNVHRTVYKEEAGEIQPCLTPLKKGGLCQRRDLRVCPFHGPIVPRDAEGNPIKQKEGSAEETLKDSSTLTTESKNEYSDAEGSLDLSTDAVEKLAKQAMKNVRQRDKDLKSLKRVKLAKVREHNEEVLRKAAIASTSYSDAFGQPTETSVQNGVEVKIKTTLASMLKKKVTVKDRVSKRLLNSRVRDSAITQLTQGDDLNYREAFPNQW
ncbi:UV-stimulated scaffold protein A homolog isoform X1 [Typha angustifolia]|uniref:UV-stimulated scaffold protein A homolog isoform X1 n=2 Tax=Typha angustifolia TaxID=59011 RepID=UPI003C2EDB7F